MDIRVRCRSANCERLGLKSWHLRGALATSKDSQELAEESCARRRVLSSDGLAALSKSINTYTVLTQESWSNEGWSNRPSVAPYLARHRKTERGRRATMRELQRRTFRLVRDRLQALVLLQAQFVASQIVTFVYRSH